MAKIKLPSFFKKHSTEILMGIGTVGFIATGVLLVKQTPKALMLIEEKKLDLETDKLTVVETIKTAGPCYISPVLIGAASLTCFIGANSIHARRNAALATACAIAETSFKDYKDKVIETLGEKKDKAVRDAVAKDKVEKNPVEPSKIIVTSNGDSLCYESLSGRYFRSDIEKIQKAVNEINRRLLFDSYISLNEFYEEIGLAETRIGEDIGWRIETGLIEIDFSSQLADGTPCLVMDYVTMPNYDYNKLI